MSATARTGGDAPGRHVGDQHVLVIGGGIAGLATAHALVTAPDAPHVTLFEASDRLGGKIRTTPFGGRPVDEGADAFLARVPWATELARRVGLGDELTAPQSGRAAVWWDELHALPDKLLLGLPTDVVALARSHLLTWPGKVRAALEPLLRRSDIGADALGAFVRSRFGDEVHVRLLDPLVGSIYAADTDHFSLAAVPQIAELAAQSRSVLLAARRRPAAPDGPVFLAPASGMGSLVDAVAAAVRARGGTIRLGHAVTEVERDGARWRIGDAVGDAVVLACPASASAAIVAASAAIVAASAAIVSASASATAPVGTARGASASAERRASAASALRSIPTADVVLITLSVDAARWPERLGGLSGYLVPKPRQRLVTAVSFGSQKWSRWGSPGRVVLRISLGRDGLPVLHLADEHLVAAAVEEVGRQLGIDLQPDEVRVSRWPAAFPQYRPHHARSIAAVEAALPEGWALAGASYHGIGIPACVRSGEQAATRTLARLGSLAD